VSGVDSSCNEGPRSDSVQITTPSGGSESEPIEEVRFSCRNPIATIEADASFVQNLPLQQGPNEILIIARDKADNRFVFKNTTLFDNQPPQFTEINLEALEVTFIPQATIRGRLSEKGTVFAYLNDQPEPVAFGLTDANGKFELPLDLVTTIPVTEADAPRGILPGQGFRNNIRIEAVDGAGLKAEITQSIVFAICGFGSTFAVSIGETAPKSLPARLILEGFGEIGFNLNLTYLDVVPFEFRGDPVVSLRLLARGEEEEDFSQEVIIESSRFNKNPKGAQGFVRVRITPPSIDPNLPTIEREQALADRTRGKCLIPGISCIRVPLEMETRFVKILERSEREVSRTGQLGPATEELVQKTCINLELAIDERIPPDVVPNKFLKESVRLFTEIINGIDEILKPLEQIYQVVFFTCIAGVAVLFFFEVYKQYHCKFAGSIRTDEGKFTVEVAETNLCEEMYGQAGKPAQVHAGEKLKNCNDCRDAVRKIKNFQYYMQFICDRAACPSAPTLQTYVKEKSREPLIPVAAKKISAPGVAGSLLDLLDVDTPGKAAATPKNLKGKQYFKGSSCAVIEEDLVRKPTGRPGFRPVKKIPVKILPTPAPAPAITRTFRRPPTAPTPPPISTPAPAGPVVTSNVARPFSTALQPGPVTITGAAITKVSIGTGKATTPSGPKQDTSKDTNLPIQREETPILNFQDVETIYKRYQNHEADKANEDPFDPTGEVNCNNPHPATPECCGFEYMEDHDSTCVFMDEIKQSYCLQAQIDGEKGSGCGGFAGFFNKIAGFLGCENQIDSAGEPVDTNLRITEDSLKGIANPEGNEYYLFVIPGGGGKRRQVLGGYAKNKLSRFPASVATTPATTPAPPPATTPEIFNLNKQIQFVRTADYSNFFLGEKNKIDCNQFLEQIITRDTRIQVIENKGLATTACQRVKTFFVGQRDQIVDPASGFLRAAQCGCIPGVNSYIKQYRNILAAVRNCFNSILITGDGSEGVCQSTLSVYICDLIYDVISCIVRRFEPGIQVGFEFGLGPVGDIFSSVTAAGSATQQRVAGRYGRTSMFKTMFTEKKLINSICLFAFTGTFDLDINAFLQAGIPPIPVDSTGLINPARRRFINFDETTDPSGLVTWNYNLGVILAAGADLNFQLELICSADFSCEPQEGFPNGKCDCVGAGLGERKLNVPVSRRQVQVQGELRPGLVGGLGLKAGELLNEEVFVNIQTAPGNNFRYDKVRLSWTFRGQEGKTRTESFERKISLIGGNAPAFCGFDILTNRFRCVLDLGNERFAKFTQDPVPVFPDDEGRAAKAYKLSDTITFDIPIVQRPDDVCSFRCQNTKFLLFEIRNPSGKILRRGQTLFGTNNQFITDPLRVDAQIGNPEIIRDEHRLNINGEKTLSLKLTEKLEDDDFKGEERVREKILPDVTLLKNIVQRVRGPPPNKDIIIEIFANGEVIKHEFTTPQKLETKPGRFVVFDVSKAKATDIRLEDDGEIIVGTIRIQTIGKDRIAETFVTFATPRQGVDVQEREKVDSIMVLLPREGAAAVQECDRFKTSPGAFTALFEIHDAEQKGGNFVVSPAVTIDIDGAPQRKEVVFNVFCNDKVLVPRAATSIAQRCPENTKILAGACHCTIDDAEVQRRIAAVEDQDCGPAVAPGTNLFCLDGFCLDKGFEDKICDPGQIIKQGDECICGKESTSQEIKCRVVGTLCQINDSGDNKCEPIIPAPLPTPAVSGPSITPQSAPQPSPPPATPPSSPTRPQPLAPPFTP